MRSEVVATAENTDDYDDPFRSVGFTYKAVDRPRDELANIALAAWCNCTVDQLPRYAKFHPNESTLRAWNRVFQAVADYQKGDLPEDSWFEQLQAHVDEDGLIGEAAARDLLKRHADLRAGLK